MRCCSNGPGLRLGLLAGIRTWGPSSSPRRGLHCTALSSSPLHLLYHLPPSNLVSLLSCLRVFLVDFFLVPFLVSCLVLCIPSQQTDTSLLILLDLRCIITLTSTFSPLSFSSLLRRSSRSPLSPVAFSRSHIAWTLTLHLILLTFDLHYIISLLKGGAARVHSTPLW